MVPDVREHLAKFIRAVQVGPVSWGQLVLSGYHVEPLQYPTLMFGHGYYGPRKVLYRSGPEDAGTELTVGDAVGRFLLAHGLTREVP
jgi:hypothetical protein